MSDYPHLLRVYRGTDPSGGAQTDDGVWTDNPALADDNEVYNDRADVQDGGVTLEKDNLASPANPSNAIAFLRKEKLIKDIKVDDSVEITWEDGTKDLARVAKVRRLDSSILLRYV